jgi:hypothetical protein
MGAAHLTNDTEYRLAHIRWFGIVFSTIGADSYQALSRYRIRYSPIINTNTEKIPAMIPRQSTMAREEMAGIFFHSTPLLQFSFFKAIHPRLFLYIYDFHNNIGRQIHPILAQVIQKPSIP